MMNNLVQPAGQSGDLFGAPLIASRSTLVRRKLPLELKVAGLLCRQIRRQPAPRDKRRIAHLICLNLLAMLKHRR
jgi:hypothetical protein